MALAVGLIFAIVGFGSILFGLGYYFAFRIGRAVFEGALKTDVAQIGKDHVASAATKIRNPMVRRIVSEHLVAAGSAAAVSVVRSVLASRMRTGLMISAVGLIALIVSFYTGSWLPLIWRTG